MRLLKLPNIQVEESVLAVMFVAGFLILPNPIGRKFLLLQQPLMTTGIIILSLIALAKRKLVFSRDWLSFVFAAFVGWQFISALWADHPDKVWKVGFAWLMLLLFYLNVREIDISSFSRSFWRKLVQLVLGANLLLITWFFIQVGAGETGYSYAASQMMELGAYFSRNDNSISSLLLLLILLLFILKRASKQYLTYSLLLVSVFFMFLINSKVPIIVLLVIAGVFLLKYVPRTKRAQSIGIVLLLLGGIVAFVFLFSDNYQTFFSGLDPSRSFRIKTGDERILLWEKSLWLWQAHPLLGIGSGNWMTAYLQYGIGEFALFKNYIHSHNLILETLSELGIIGGMMIVFLLLIPPFTYFAKRSRSLPPILFAFLFTFLALSFYYGIAYCINGRFAAAQYLWAGGLAIWSSRSYPLAPTYKVRGILLALAILCFCWQAFYVHQILTYKSYRIAFARHDFQEGEKLYERLYSPYIFEFVLDKHIPGIHGKSLMQSRQYKKAATYLEASTRSSPYEYQNWFSLGTCYVQLGEQKKAIQAFDASLRLNPNDLATAFQLAELSFLEKDWAHFDKAISTYYDVLLPQIEDHYNEATWFQFGPDGTNYGNITCGFQDQFILLMDKRDRIFQVESDME